MNQDLVKRVKNVLNSQYYFMNNDWLSDCIQFYLDENTTAQDREIINFVKNQWQLSDLREINNENGCLPPNLNQQKVTTLGSTYILQMEKIYDAATSKYKQLENIRNVSTVNIEVTENEEKQVWEPKKKRMLYLYLTDGIQNITAMEYEPMNCLTDSVLPGHKVMIVGPVQCRRGVLLLQQHTFKKIGGEVESLLIPNAVENVLARALGLPENADPYNTEKKDDANNDKRNAQEKDFFEDEFEVDLEQVCELERRSQELENNFHARQQNLTTSKKISESTLPKEEQQSSNTNIIEFTDDDLMELINDDEMYTTIPKESIDQQYNVGLLPSKQISSENKNEESMVSINEQDKNAVKNASTNNVMDDEIILSEFSPEKVSCKKEASNVIEGHVNNLKSLDTNAIFNKKSSSNSTMNIRPSTSTSKTIPVAGSINKNSLSSTIKQTVLKKGTTPTTNKKKKLTSSPSTSVTKMRSSQEGQKHSNGTRKISDFIVKASETIKPDLPKICDFICDIITQNITETMHCTVRGRTVSLGKLSKDDQCWHLDGTITDQTASLDVSFSPQVLENIIGLSVKQFLEKRKLAKSDPALEHDLRMFCRNGETKLKRMDALLELELTGSNTKPKIMNITPLSDQQKQIIEKRIKLLKL